MEILRTEVIFVRIKLFGLTTVRMKEAVEIWLVTTDHLEDGLWFPKESDFIVGMNLAAALAADMPVLVLAFVLMSNHVHFVLLATRMDAEQFINEYKRRHSKYLNKKYGIEKLLKNNDWDIRFIPSEGEAPEKAIAYVQMNPVAAGICLHPTQYPWGSGDVFFTASQSKGVRLDTLSERARRRILHSKTRMPGHWLLSDEGYVLPSSFVKRETVEQIFRTAKRMDYFLRNSSKAKQRLESSEDSQPTFKDQVVLAAIPDLCRALFQKMGFKELSDSQKSEILRQLRFRFSSNVHQLARVACLTYDDAARLLDLDVSTT